MMWTHSARALFFEVLLLVAASSACDGNPATDAGSDLDAAAIEDSGVDSAVANPCDPSPCADNASCRGSTGVAVCTCNAGTLGDGLTCAALWDTVVAIPGLDLSDYFLVVGAENRIYFARGRDPIAFRSLDVTTHEVRDEVLMAPETDDLAAAGFAASLVYRRNPLDGSPGWIHSFGDWFEVYPVDDPGWVEIPMPLELLRGQAGVTYDQVTDRTYVVGGRSRASAQEASVQYHDYTSWSWQMEPSFPVAVLNPAVGIIDGVLYATAGQLAASPNTVLASHDLAGGGWIVLGTIPFEAARAQGAVAGGRLWVFSGQELWAYAPSTDEWSGPFTSPIDHAWWRMTAVQDELYLVGTTDVRSDPAATTVLRYAGPGSGG